MSRDSETENLLPIILIVLAFPNPYNAAALRAVNANPPADKRKKPYNEIKRAGDLSDCPLC
jgi:hypothetical protein